MVTEAMEQEQRHDHDEEEDTTEDSFGATVILGKGEYILCIYVDWSSFSPFWHLSNSVEGIYLEKLVALQPLKNYLNYLDYGVLKHLPLDPFLGQTNPVHNIPLFF